MIKKIILTTILAFTFLKPANINSAVLDLDKIIFFSCAGILAYEFYSFNEQSCNAALRDFRINLINFKKQIINQENKKRLLDFYNYMKVQPSRLYCWCLEKLKNLDQVFPNLIIFENKNEELKQIQKEKAEAEEKLKKEKESRLCVACLTKEKNYILTPCNHIALCYDCALHICETTKICPICRKNVETYEPAYF